MRNLTMLALTALLVSATLTSVASAENDKRILAEQSVTQDIIARLDALSKTVNECVEKLGHIHEPVAFKAHLSRDVVSPAANQRIIFDDVQLNLGNAYHEHLGAFLAPVNGTYLFSVSICSNGGHYIVLDLMRNGAMIGKILAGDDSYADCSSETTITKLQAGDEVFLQHHGIHGDLLDTQDALLDSFTGALLQAI